MIVGKALEKRQQDRYRSADSMIRDLRRALRHPDGRFMMGRDAGKNEHLRRDHPRGGPVMRAAMFVAALCVVAVIAVTGGRMYTSMFLMTRVPDLLGVDTSTAERMLSSAGLGVQVSYAYSDMTEGYISRQSPAANESVRKGEIVEMTVSLGSGKVAVQRYIGMEQDEALAALSAQGFVAGEITVVPSAQMRGTVVEQSPEVGVGLEPGTRVALTVSGGRVVVPELIGEREEEAIARVNSLGLACGMITYENVSDARQDGIVLSQSLEKFTEVLPESVVEMTVGFYDKRRYTAHVALTVSVPPEGVGVRVTLVGEDGRESDMYAARHEEPGEISLDVLLRSETSGVMAWRLYLDGSFKSEATAVLQ